MNGDHQFFQPTNCLHWLHGLYYNGLSSIPPTSLPVAITISAKHKRMVVHDYGGERLGCYYLDAFLQEERQRSRACQDDDSTNSTTGCMMDGDTFCECPEL